VVLNYDSPEDSLEAVASLLRSTYLDQHVVVVDNAVDRSAQDWLKDRLPDSVSYLPMGENAGYAVGNNRGIAFLMDGGVDYVCVVNPDARVGSSTVEGLVRAADRSRDAGFVGPRLIHGGSNPVMVQSDGGHVDWSRGGATRHVHGDTRIERVPAGVGHVDYVTGACVLLRRAMLEDVGFIPEEYFLYYEETEHALRAARRGWTSIVDRDVQAHHFRRSTASVPSRSYIYYMTRNRAVFAQRNHGADDVVERALADLDETFLVPWAARVAERLPNLSDTFAEVVSVAKQHGRMGSTGRFEDLAKFAVDDVPGWTP
jgi:GT2 family glycosyltransferase